MIKLNVLLSLPERMKRSLHAFCQIYHNFKEIAMKAGGRSVKYLAGESQRTVDLASSMLGARRRMRGLRKNRTEVIMESVHNKNTLVFTGLIR